MIRIGVESGGTFTDLVRMDGESIRVHKVRSTPHDPSQAILAAIGDVMDGQQPDEVVHGSTVATNALLERKGARVAFITTRGFEDVLLIGRQTRAELYNFQVRAPRPLIEPGLTFGVAERIAADGTILEPLADAAIQTLIEVLRTRTIDSVAICLLHSYANPAHELALTTALTAAGFQVSASHQILPEYREFERSSTTAVNAYVTPIMARYLGRLEAAQPGTPLRIMQSNGGFLSAHSARAAAVHTVLSGPAAGVVGAQAIAAASGFPRIITFDMGGTSTDVSLVDDEIHTTSESVVGDFPVRIPMLDIHTVGAGGGSIVFVDSGGALRVGPRSAGADPGPACYGTGTELTVTDANLLLGRLDPDSFLGGRMQLDIAGPRELARTLAARVGLAEHALLEGILRIANANMVRAIRAVSVERGFDPRDFALLAFGGAGGLHACEMAGMLEIATVLIPEHAGVLSALGMLLADAVQDYSRTLLRPTAEVSEEGLREAFVPMLDQGRQHLAREGFSGMNAETQCALDLRYIGQGFEITIPFAADFEAAFHAAHQKHYGYASPNRPTEIVHLRVKAIGRTMKPQLPRSDDLPRPLPEPAAVRRIRFKSRAHPTPLYRRESLAAGMRGEGPALLAGAHSMSLIPPGFAFQIDALGTVIATQREKDRAVPGEVSHAD